MLPPHIDPHPSLQCRTPWLNVLMLQLHPHDSPLKQPPQVRPHPHHLPCSQVPSDTFTTSPPSPPQLTMLALMYNPQGMGLTLPPLPTLSHPASSSPQVTMLRLPHLIRSLWWLVGIHDAPNQIYMLSGLLHQWLLGGNRWGYSQCCG
ncbi:hypothetical protein O181_059239 [Austropuccinia psidii MF-1]|uniref:Uncharacterized protein n=1 Tax=Austropuccinia psidii MF-1 TaxID=1389203 RepID=A0A9Q3EDW9_9BASI|nr:hypothetical protein [Austropuccinia psidii MF-1]